MFGLPPNTLSAVILLAVIALSPLPLGTTSPIFIATECGLLGLAAMALTLRTALKIHIVYLFCLGLVLIAYLLALHEQLSLTPWFAGKFAPPWWERASVALGEPLPATPSVVRGQGWFSLGAPLLAGLALVNSFVICTYRHWARRLVDWTLWIGSIYAVIGIVSFMVDPTHIFSFEKYAYREVLTATFINRNTAAVYFGACFVLGAVKTAVAFKQDVLGSRERRKSGRPASSELPRSVLVPAALGVLNLLATLLTVSRAGIVLTLIAGLTALGLIFRDQLAHLRRRGLVAALGAVAGLVIAVGILGGGVVSRFALQGLSDGGRGEIYEAVGRLIRDNWLFGTGLGTFRWAFAPYRPEDVPIWGIWDRAHNVLLEIAAEMGIPLALCVLVAAVSMIVILARGAIIRRRDRDIPIIGLAVALLSFGHAMVDFSLQIPGYSVTAFAIIGAGLAQAFRTGGRPLTLTAEDRLTGR